MQIGKVSCETKRDPCSEYILAQPHSFECALKCQTSHNLVSEFAACTELQLQAAGADNANTRVLLLH